MNIKNKPKFLFSISVTTCFILGNFCVYHSLLADSVPVIVTNTASSVATTSAVFNGQITDTGGNAITSRGFLYGTNISYSNTVSENGLWNSTPISFSTTSTDFVCGTTYHYAAFAANSSGTNYGQDQSFTTSACPVYHLTSCPTTTDIFTDENNEFMSRVNKVSAPNNFTSSSRDETFDQLFSTYGDSSGGFVWNASSWEGFSDSANGISPLDFSGVKMYPNMHCDSTLISPRHILLAGHCSDTYVGAQEGFVSPDGNLTTRTLESIKYINLNNSYGSPVLSDTYKSNQTTDVAVGLLDSPVPSDVTYYPIISYADLSSKMTPMPNTFSIPVVNPDQNGNADIRIITSLNKWFAFGFSGADNSSSYYAYGLENDGNDNMINQAHGGDSGHPMFFVIDGKLVLASAFYSASQGPLYSYLLPQIDQAISDLDSNLSDLGNGYQATSFDTSCFNAYVPLSFSDQQFSVPENSQNGTVVGALQTNNGRSPLTFSIISGNTNDAFAIDSSSGQITVLNKNALTYVTNPVFNLSVSVYDSWKVPNNQSPITKTITITVVPNQNDASLPSFSLASSTVIGTWANNPVAQAVTDAYGDRLAVVDNVGNLYISIDYGSTLSHVFTFTGGNSMSIAISPDGKNLTYSQDISNQNRIYYSNDGGVSWKFFDAGTPGNYFSSFAYNATGLKIVAVDNGGNIWISSNGGTNWNVSASSPVLSWSSVSSDSSGKNIFAVAGDGNVYLSSDSGNTWNTVSVSGAVSLKSISSDASGRKLFASDSLQNGKIYISNDGGSTWTSSQIFPLGIVSGPAVSSDGETLVAVNGNRNAEPYISTDGGGSWRVMGLSVASSSLPSMTSSGNLIIFTSYPSSVDVYSNIPVTISVQNSTTASNSNGATHFSSGGGGGGGGGSSYVQPVLNKSPQSSMATFINLLITLGLIPANKISMALSIASSTPVAIINENTSNSSSYSFSRNLSLGSNGDDVKALQIFLNNHGFIVSVIGSGSIGNETTTFGPLTETAIKVFQKAYGIEQTGTVGPITRAEINELQK